MVGHAIFPTAAQYTREYYGLDESPESIMAEWEALAQHHYAHLVPLKEGAEEILRHCRKNAIPTTLFTACRAPLCRAVLARFDLEQYFDHIVFAEEIGLEKHDPRCFTRLCEIIGADPADCTLFDDSPSNCATARAAGMKTVGVYDFFYSPRWDEMQTVCTRCVHSLEELL
jgi:HAD superfamily hydrolase (TIGR01509 family)